ncbi:MAG: sigma-70 family RNA polymerase sigma factor [Planctomycetaceae bacterium]
MNDSASSMQQLLSRARNGDDDALGELCNRHRPYLRLMTQRALDSRVKVRADESDLVQQTMLSAVRNFAQFQGSHAAQFVAWLQVLHERNVVDAARLHKAEKRDINREGTGFEDHDHVFASSDSPSVRAMRSEEAVQLAEALELLPVDQREAVRLRHLEGWSLKNMAKSLDRSEEAVAGLIKRGMAELRKHVRAEPGD